MFIDCKALSGRFVICDFGLYKTNCIEIDPMVQRAEQQLKKPFSHEMEPQNVSLIIPDFVMKKTSPQQLM